MYQVIYLLFLNKREKAGIYGSNLYHLLALSATGSYWSLEI